MNVQEPYETKNEGGNSADCKGGFSRFFLNVAAFYDTIQTYHLGFLTAIVSC